jgi:ABC-type multidrug transport system fused ATPase/permease subunit
MSGLPDAGSAPARRRHPGLVAVLKPQLYAARWTILAAILLTSVSGAAISYQNLFPKWLVSDVLEPAGLDAGERWRRLLLLLAGYLAVSFLVRMTLWHIGYRLFTRARERIVFRIRAHFFRHVNHLCLRFHGRHPSGELFSYLFGSPLGNVVGFIQQCTMMLPHTGIALVATLALFWSFDPFIAAVLLCTTLSSVWMMERSRRRMHRLWADFHRLEGEVSGRVADQLRGLRAVKLYAMEPTIAADFDDRAQAIGAQTTRRDISSHLEWMKQEGIGYLAFTLLVAACSWRYLSGRIDLGTVAACLTSFAALQWPIQVLFQTMTQFGAASAAARRIDLVFRAASSTPDPEGEALPAPGRGEITFAGVDFAYHREPVLRGIDLRIPYGQRVAVVGPSGAGKSTLVQLMLRLYDPQRGTVSIAGTDLRRLRGRDLRQRFGVVPQDPFIFRSTLRDNLRVARPEADDDAIRRACEAANAWEFIERLPAGLDTRVGEGGSTLSGGQRQRLAIARVLLGDPDYLVFDEATSALDSISERLIQDAIERSLGGRTGFFIAHRLATVRHCDRILVLREGRIVQDGSYAELAAVPGLFRDLVAGQSLIG